MSKFAENLHRLRKERKITQVKLASVLNYGYTAIANYESGRNEPSLDDLISLADYFDVSLDELLGREHISETDRLYGRLCRLSPAEREKIHKLIDIMF